MATAENAMPGEVWKPVPGHEGYLEASSLGRIRSLDHYVEQATRWGGTTQALYRGRLVAGHREQSGYIRVRVGHGKAAVGAHRLVCAAFHGPAPTDRPYAAHINGRRDDNRPENLRWANARENDADKDRHGTRINGERVPGAKLNADAVREMRALFWGGGDIHDIAKKYSVSPECAAGVVCRVRWAHVD